ncbi:Type III secretion protein YscO [Thiothrix eikelboomii]|uniref:Type III secretion protein YscO n=1 Tax=Thiothrix eikelboomii TaxID=92487 RepID=A0A1T4WCK1_9GAMM|nr:YscO family type III secretion system apparatus protein [Thiothrix eikelboomii]SKA75044.1 Type III secretion protein YscO [Thiothrix eikelboomii]
MSLVELQKIRERRLEKKQTEVMQAKQAVTEAERNLAQTIIKMEKFREWRLTHQEELFKGLQNQACTPQVMQEYQTKLVALSQQEEQLRAAIPNAQKLLEQANQNLSKIRSEMNALAMKNEKTKEIVETQQKAELQLALYIEQNQDP